jgi:hydroxypyruvate reductase
LGSGGRNQETALSAALAIEGAAGIVVSCLATDGVDGPTNAAGAIVDGSSATRMRDRGIDPEAALENNNAYPALEAVGDLLITGPTGTNVADLYLVLIGGADPSSKRVKV